MIVLAAIVIALLILAALLFAFGAFGGVALVLASSRAMAWALDKIREIWG